MTRRSLLQKLQAWLPFIPMYVALRVAKYRAQGEPFRRKPKLWGKGISVLIPECGTPELLDGTLQHATAAILQVEEPAEIIVQVNGAEASMYAMLQQKFPTVVWRFVPEALGFNGAIEAGLQAVKYDGVYLLNSDMRIASDAIQQLLHYRTPSTFALASQIFFADQSQRREETGWSDFYVHGARTVVYERDPGDLRTARGTLYAGGGSSLFRTDILREYVRDSRGYSPFYWEDADWGVRAWAEGLECVFVPQSHAVHVHRGTIKKRFTAQEIDRIIDRNALQFELRHHFTDMDGYRAVGHLAGQARLTRSELKPLSIARGVAEIRARNDAAKRQGFRFTDVVHKYYLPRPYDRRPTILWVTPFSVYPPSHGGARRVGELARRISQHVNLVLLSDEGRNYEKAGVQPDFSPFRAVHLLQARIDPPGQQMQDLTTRMAVHTPEHLREEMRRLQQQYEFDLVQVEFMEATRLVEARYGTAPFVASLHDVYLDGGQHDAMQLDTLRKYDCVVACSEEDERWLPGLQTRVVGNGAVDRYDLSPPSPDTKQILFMGPFRYQQNFTGICAFIEHVWSKLIVRHPEAELVILGGVESADARFFTPLLRQSGVRLISQFVDTAPLLASCALTINPQQEIRGSALKVAESLLSRRVCVSTAHGARGFDHLDASSLRICSDWSIMLNELDQLLADPARRRQLEVCSPEVRASLSWDGKAQQLFELYRSLIPHHFTSGTYS